MEDAAAAFANEMPTMGFLSEKATASPAKPAPYALTIEVKPAGSCAESSPEQEAARKDVLEAYSR